jgi:hypothetical protein
MKKLSITLIALLVFSISLSASEFAGGTGTEQEPYQIATADHLNNVRNHLNAHFLQIADIDLNVMPYNMGNYFLPIGGSRIHNEITDNFTGSYDGNGYEIRNIIIVQPGNFNVGLFGHIGRSDEGETVVKNVHLNNVIVIGGRGTGSLVGRITGNQNTRIENCSVETGYVRGDAATGGLIGSNNSYMINSVAAEGYRPVISKSWANVSVLLRSQYSEGKTKFGGLVGCNQKGMITNSYSFGEVVVNNSEATAIGGLAGCIDLRGVIINSYSATAVYADSTDFTGGFVGSLGIGRNKGYIYNSYWRADVNPASLESNGVVALSDEQMRQYPSFEGWDFNNVWQIKADLNDGFPSLFENSAVKIERYWTGNISDSWHEPLNWSPEGVPSSTDAVTIRAESFNQPVVKESVTINNITIEDFAVLTLDGAMVDLNVKGTLNNGFESIGAATVRGEGAIVLAGSSLQKIPAMTFDNLVIDNPNNARLMGSIRINNMLKMGQGLLDLHGFEILLSETARLSETENDNVSSRVYGSSGVIRTERYLDKPAGDIAGLGIEITSNENLGLTVIERGHSPLNEGDESKSILRWFNIEPANNQDLNATLVFHYFISELNIYGENDNFSLFRRRHGDSEWIWIPSSLDPVNQILTANNVDEFSTWTAGSTDKPLPIVLLSWEAKEIDDYTNLTWVTAAEVNNDYFTIERSSDGIDFEAIGTIHGAGTTSESNFYSFYDREPLRGISYYRLKQTDFNGDFEYSKIVSVSNNKMLVNDYQIYPNPSNGQFNILIKGDTSSPFSIVDMQGKTVFVSVAEPGQITPVSLPELNRGIYTLIFSGSETISKKIQVL